MFSHFPLKIMQFLLEFYAVRHPVSMLCDSCCFPCVHQSAIAMDDIYCNSGVSSFAFSLGHGLFRVSDASTTGSVAYPTICEVIDIESRTTRSSFQVRSHAYY